MNLKAAAILKVGQFLKSQDRNLRLRLLRQLIKTEGHFVVFVHGKRFFLFCLLFIVFFFRLFFFFSQFSALFLLFQYYFLIFEQFLSISVWFIATNISSIFSLNLFRPFNYFILYIYFFHSLYLFSFLFFFHFSFVFPDELYLFYFLQILICFIDSFELFIHYLFPLFCISICCFI